MPLFCNLQNRARTHAVLVIGLYELLGNPITYIIEPPGPSYQYVLRYWTVVKNVEEVTTKSNFIRCIRKLGMATAVYCLNLMSHITNQSVLAHY